MDKEIDTRKPRLIMVTGGQRSGKSLFAESLALSMSARPVYLASAHVYDDEMKKRVEIHKQRREKHWRNLESPLHITENTFQATDVVLLDCLTLWATNWFFELGEQVEDSLMEMKKQIEEVLKTGATFIMVTNEVGLGGVSANAMQRKFADLQGYLNQFVAERAEEVYLIVSGIPVKIK